LPWKSTGSPQDFLTPKLTGSWPREPGPRPLSANLAEGHARATRRDFANFVAVAKGSLMEAETFLMLAVRLGYVAENEASVGLGLIMENGKMLTALRKRLKEVDP
jgi:23S rRNA-intervening sequence protein